MNKLKITKNQLSNSVGVGVPDDPQTKTKYINKLMSNNIDMDLMFTK